MKTEVSGGTGPTQSQMPSKHTDSVWPLTPSRGTDFGMMGLGPGCVLWERPYSIPLRPQPTPLHSLAGGLTFLSLLSGLFILKESKKFLSLTGDGVSPCGCRTHFEWVTFQNGGLTKERHWRPVGDAAL